MALANWPRYVHTDTPRALSVNHSLFHRLRKIGQPKSPEPTSSVPYRVSGYRSRSRKFQEWPALDGQKLYRNPRVHEPLRFADIVLGFKLSASG